MGYIRLFFLIAKEKSVMIIMSKHIFFTEQGL